MMTKNINEKSFSEKIDKVQEIIINKYSLNSKEKKKFIIKFSKLKSEMKSRWIAAKRTEDKFLTMNRDWLQGTISMTRKKISSVGRPSKDFEDLSERSKRRKTEPFRKEMTAPELLYASQMVLRQSGNIGGALVVKDIITSPKRGDKYRKALQESNKSDIAARSMTPTQALSIFVEAALTRIQYEIVRTSDRKLYPCYTILQKAKNECYPCSDSFRVTENCAEVELQALLNHTGERLLLYLDEVVNALSESDLGPFNLELIHKWDYDGSQQTQYKQKFENSTDSDSNIFQSTLVPLRLCMNGKIIWQNPTPSSPRFCRPMRIRYI